MIHHEHERELVERARTALDESLGALDGDTVARLAAARRQALGLRRRWSTPVLAAAGGLLAATLALAIGVSWWSRALPEMASVEELEDLEILVASEDLDLLENLEFYEWLDADDATG